MSKRQRKSWRGELGREMWSEPSFPLFTWADRSEWGYPPGSMLDSLGPDISSVDPDDDRRQWTHRPGVRRPVLAEWADWHVNVVPLPDVEQDTTGGRGGHRDAVLGEHGPKSYRRKRRSAVQSRNVELSSGESRGVGNSRVATDFQERPVRGHSKPSTRTQEWPRTGNQEWPRTGHLTVHEPSLLTTYVTTSTGSAPMSESPSSRVVKSPAGEPVEIVPDQTWAELTDTHPNVVSHPQASKLAPLRALWEHGTIRNHSGQAIRELAQLARPYGYTRAGSDPRRQITSLSTLLRDPLNTPCVRREIHGRRTTELALVALPETWHDRIVKATRSAVGHPGLPHPRPEPVNPEPVSSTNRPPPVVSSTAVSSDTAAQVAMHLLARVVEMINEGERPTTELETLRKERDTLARELKESQERLAHVIEAGDRLRDRLRDTGEELHATKQERDGLRTRLRMAEHNVQAVLNGQERNAVGDAIQRELTKLMTAPPAGSKGPDGE